MTSRSQTEQVAHDVRLLLQLQPLGLTRSQILRMRAIFRQPTTNPTQNTQTDTQLLAVKQTLLEGKEPGRIALRDAMRGLQGQAGWYRRAREEQLKLLDKLIAVLTPPQKALLSQYGSMAGAAARIRRGGSDEAVTEVFLSIQAIPANEWPKEKARIATCLAEASRKGEPADHKRDAAAFLERVHGMSEAQIRAQVHELVADADALMPDVPTALPYIAPLDQKKLERRAAQLLLDPNMPRLLDEIVVARQWGTQ